MGSVIRPAYACWSNPVKYDPDKPRCSFCGAGKDDCKKMFDVKIRGVVICDACVKISKRLLDRVG